MKVWLPALAGLLLCGAVAWGEGAPATPLVPIVPGENKGAPHVTAFAALDYFGENCARCHGEYGSFYGKDFGKNRDDAQMHEVVDEMAQGPAGAPLDEADLKVLVAWHLALRDGKPFVALISAKPDQGGWQLEGEVSPDATLQVNGETLEIKGAKWTHHVAAGPVKLRAQKGEAVTQVDADAAAFGP